MFFTRLAVAALSFGSIAQVFAAPVSTGLEPIDASGPAIDGSPVRRDDLTFLATVAQVIGVVEPLNAKIASLAADPAGAVTPQLVSAMGEVATALAPVSAKVESLQVPGVDKDAILFAVDDLTKTTPGAIASKTANLFQMVADICHLVAGLQSASLLATQFESIKAEVIRTQTGAQALSDDVTLQPLLGLLGIVIGDIAAIVPL